MKLEEWMLELCRRLNQEEIGNLDVQRAELKVQFKNPVTEEVELHEWAYTAKGAERLVVRGAGNN